MSEKLKISIVANGTSGRVSIIGSIDEWNENSAEIMRSKCVELNKAGVKEVTLYLMTEGGDCFQSNEIKNILNSTFGSYAAEGGALVASAGANILAGAAKGKRMVAGNIQFMIHKPSGWVRGNDVEMTNYLTLLKNMTNQHYADFVSVLTKPEADFKEKWESGDFWLTAKEVVDWGFADGIIADNKVDRKTAALFTKSRNPIETDNNLNHNKNNLNMNILAYVKILGMDDSTTEEQLSARLVALKSKAEKYDALREQYDNEKKERLNANIEAKLNNAVKNKKIKADNVDAWKKKLQDDYDGTVALLDSIEAVVKPDYKKPSGKVEGSTHGKTFEQLQEESPELLAELQETDPEAYESLFADWKKKNKLK